MNRVGETSHAEGAGWRRGTRGLDAGRRSPGRCWVRARCATRSAPTSMPPASVGSPRCIGWSPGWGAGHPAGAGRAGRRPFPLQFEQLAEIEPAYFGTSLALGHEQLRGEGGGLDFQLSLGSTAFGRVAAALAFMKRLSSTGARERSMGERARRRTVLPHTWG